MCKKWIIVTTKHVEKVLSEPEEGPSEPAQVLSEPEQVPSEPEQVLNRQMM